MADATPSTGSAEEQEAGGTSRGVLGVLRRHPEFRHLFLSDAISGSGDYLFLVALLAYLLDRTGSPFWIAAVGLIRLVPPAVLSSVAGVVADRVDRRRLMVVLDLARAALMVGLIVVAATEAPVILAAGLALASAIVSTPYRPAVAAVTPQVVGEEDLAAANAATGGVAQLVIFVGPALGALLVGIGSVEVAFAVNAVTFLVSALLVAQVRSAGGRPRGDATDEEPGASGLLRDLVEGVQVLRASRHARFVVALVGAFQLAVGFELVLHVLVAEEELGLGSEGAGYLLGAIGVGGLLTVPFAGRIADSEHAGWGLVAAAVLTGGPIALLSVITVPWIAFAVLLLEGVGNILFDVLVLTMLQRLLDGEVLARAVGLEESVAYGATALGTLLAPAAVTLLGLDIALAGTGVLLTAFGLLAAPALLATGREAVERSRLVAPRVALLRRLGVFEGAPTPTLEQLARCAEPVTVTAGTTVVREGEPARDFYLVRDGAFEVSVRSGPDTDAVINRLGPDDWFGEIGLLERRPRTASVVATEAAELYRIPGEDFLAAITATPIVPERLRMTVSSRLRRSDAVALPLVEEPAT